jgi:hypothetical protein
MTEVTRDSDGSFVLFTEGNKSSQIVESEFVELIIKRSGDGAILRLNENDNYAEIHITLEQARRLATELLRSAN